MSSDQERRDQAHPRADVEAGTCSPQSHVRAVCPNCGAALEEIRAKFHCPRCRLICETCCEGGR